MEPPTLDSSKPVVALGLHVSSYDGLVAREVTKALQRRLLIGTTAVRPSRMSVLNAGGYRLLPRASAETVKRIRDLAEETRSSPSNMTWIFPHGQRVRASAEHQVEGGGLTIARVADADVVLVAFVFEVFKSLRPTVWVTVTDPVNLPRNRGDAKGYVRDELASLHESLCSTVREGVGNFVPLLRCPTSRALVGSLPIDLRELNRAIKTVAPTSELRFDGSRFVIASSDSSDSSESDASPIAPHDAVAAVQRWYGPHTAAVVESRMNINPKESYA